MSKPAAMQCDYVDLRFVKGRKVAQIVLEIPIEAGTAFVAAFGSPDPSVSCPVAIAKLEPSALKQQLEQSLVSAMAAPDDFPITGHGAVPKPKGGKRAQWAGILCNEGAFLRFVGEQIAKLPGAHPTQDKIDVDDVVVWLRAYCGVISRADLDHNPEAARKFNELVREYEAWKLAA